MFIGFGTLQPDCFIWYDVDGVLSHHSILWFHYVHQWFRLVLSPCRSDVNKSRCLCNSHHAVVLVCCLNCKFTHMLLHLQSRCFYKSFVRYLSRTTVEVHASSEFTYIIWHLCKRMMHLWKIISMTVVRPRKHP